MIDLIIPHYNNIEGLKRTLASIDTHIFDVLVLDDASTDDISFIKSLPKHYLFLRNCGPGKVRQHGLRMTDKSYVMFMDAGDVFTSFEAQQGIAAAAYAYPDVNVFSFPYFHKGKLTKETDNRIHGKLYKREFLNKYDISFAPESSYLNEDIGFNRICRLCTEAENQPIFFGKLPVLDQENAPDSLSNRENGVALYRDQTRALSLVSIHTIETCEHNDIDAAAEINQIAISLYYWFIRTAAERPQFMQDAWTGARIFYKHYEKEIDPNKLLLGNSRLKQCLQFREKIGFTINILRFAHDILNNEIIPNNYLT